MRLKLLLALSLCCLTAALQEAEIQKEWLNFQINYGRKYRSQLENKKSFQNFRKNLQIITEHNKRFEQGVVTYKMALNPFTDMDLKEMENSYMGLKISKNYKQIFPNSTQFVAITNKKLKQPTAMDWRDHGAIGSVKDQKACGSCWAFSTTGALEAHYFLKYNKTVILSEQNLVDCSTENSGCQGGWMYSAYDYVRLNGGINPETHYPYEAVDGPCRFQSNYIATTCKGYNTIRENDEQHLLEAVASVGPIAVAIDANSNFMNYKEGIYNDPGCTQNVNHAVLVVGYGTENDQDYWLVRNSWSSEWGDGGYIKMARNKDSQCAIAKFGSYPLV